MDEFPQWERTPEETIGDVCMDDHGTGWENRRRGHFDEIVKRYDAVRPEYPARLFTDIFAYAGADHVKTALEIGAGTGKATHPFLSAGFDVTAVELSVNMAAFLRERYKAYPNFSVIAGAFEDADLTADSCDIVYAASAFHWVNAEVGCPKVFRLLKDGGTIALLRYNFNVIPPDGELLSDEIGAVYDRHMYSYYTGTGRYGVQKMTARKFTEDPRIRMGYGFDDLGAYGFRDVTMKLYEAQRDYTADEWVAMLDTLSDHRNLPEKNRTALYEGVRTIITRHGGRHTVDFVFQLYLGRKMIGWVSKET
jgi:SAM-dependent methyltransferase